MISQRLKPPWLVSVGFPRHGNDDTETGNQAWPTIKAGSIVSYFWHKHGIFQQPKIQYYAVSLFFFLMGDLVETFSWKIEFYRIRW